MTSKFLPRSTYELIGQEAAEQEFINSWKTSRVPHAWLFSGLEGIGKATLSYRIARFVLSEQNKRETQIASLFGEQMAEVPENLFVNRELPHCRLIETGAHPELRVLEPGWINPKTGRASQKIVIDQVRESTAVTNLTTTGWRVIIIDPVDAMTINAANALLKNLEEPPMQTLFLLVCHSRGRLLQTIKSRCRQVNLRPLATEQVKTFLSGTLGKTDPSIDGIAVLSRGSIGRALQLALGNGYAIYEAFFRVVSSLPQLNIESVNALSDLASKKKEEGGGNFPMLADLISDWIASVILLAVTDSAETEVIKGENELKLRLFKGGASLNRWFEVWEKTSDVLRGVEKLNLDRQQVLFECFSMLATVVSTER